MKFKKLAVVCGVLLISNTIYAQDSFSTIGDKTGWTNVTVRLSSIVSGKMKYDDTEVTVDNNTGATSTEQDSDSDKLKTSAIAEVSASHFVTNNWAWHVNLALPTKYKVSHEELAGDVDFFKVTQVAVVAQHHFDNPDSKIKPYVGAGINYAKFSDFILCEDTDTCSYDKSNVGAIIQAGFNYDLGDNLSLNVEAKMPFMKFDYKTEDDDGTERNISTSKNKFSPLIIGVGVGYIF